MTREELEQMSEMELDDLVHDLKGVEASKINNEGKETQCVFVRSAGVLSPPGSKFAQNPHVSMGWTSRNFGKNIHGPRARGKDENH